MSCSYRCISYQLSQGYHCQGQDCKNLERAPCTEGLLQPGVWPGDHGEAGLAWILYVSSEPKKSILLKVEMWRFQCFIVLCFVFDKYLLNIAMCLSTELKNFCSHTSVAPSKRSLRTTPTRLNGGMTFQQVLNSQEPETPWHLHSTCMLCRMAWGWHTGEYSARGADCQYLNGN